MKGALAIQGLGRLKWRIGSFPSSSQQTANTNSPHAHAYADAFLSTRHFFLFILKFFLWIPVAIIPGNIDSCNARSKTRF